MLAVAAERDTCAGNRHIEVVLLAGVDALHEGFGGRPVDMRSIAAPLVQLRAARTEMRILRPNSSRIITIFGEGGLTAGIRRDTCKVPLSLELSASGELSGSSG